MSDLDKLFGDFEDNARRGRDEKAQQEAQREELRKRNIEFLITTVQPVLDELSRSINEKGYKSSVAANLEPYSYPHIELSFTPEPKSGAEYSYRATSGLRFVHTDSGKIEVKESIKAGEGKSFSGYHDPDSLFDREQITQELVRKKAMAFVEKVLKAS